MSNHSAFNPLHLKKLLEPFAPGMAQHITPIKYEALTPDCFLFLFRTTGKDGLDYFFVSLETDYLNGLTGAECTVEDWHGSFIKFLPLTTKTEESDEIEDYQAVTDGPYFAMLAEVKRPTNKGYWAEALVIMPGDKIGSKIKHLTKDEQANIRKTLDSVLRHKVDPAVSFLDSFHRKTQDTIVDDINMTNMAVSLYVQPSDKVECFYNYVDHTVGGKIVNEKKDDPK